MGLITLAALGLRITNMKSDYYWRDNANFLKALNLYNNGIEDGVTELLDIAMKEMKKKGFLARMINDYD